MREQPSFEKAPIEQSATPALHAEQAATGGEAQAKGAPYWVTTPAGAKLVLPASNPQQGTHVAPPANNPQQGKLVLSANNPQQGKLVLSANNPQQGAPVPPAILPEKKVQPASPFPVPSGAPPEMKAPEPVPGLQRSETPAPVSHPRTVEQEPTRLLPFNRRPGKLLGKRTPVLLTCLAGFLVAALFAALLVVPHLPPQAHALSGSNAQWFFPHPSPQAQPVSHLPSTLPEAITTLQANNRFFYQGNADLPEVALTFDDGPSPAYTPRVLDILKQFQIHATFFDVGNLVETYPDLAHREWEEGHTVGNHTWSHPSLPTLAEKDVTMQIQRTSEAIKQAIGASPVFMRPPYGDLSDNVLQVINSFALTTVIWNVDPEDWSLPGTPTIVTRVLNEVSNGAIILLHDGGGVREQTVQALPTIIQQLRARGYKFVTMSELAAHTHHGNSGGTPEPTQTGTAVPSTSVWDSSATLGPSDISEANARRKADFS